MLYKRGKFYWLDIRINGNRIRRSLDTTNKLEALSRYAEKKEELIKEFKEGQVRLIKSIIMSTDQFLWYLSIPDNQVSSG